MLHFGVDPSRKEEKLTGSCVDARNVEDLCRRVGSWGQHNPNPPRNLGRSDIPPCFRVPTDRLPLHGSKPYRSFIWGVQVELDVIILVYFI